MPKRDREDRPTPSSLDPGGKPIDPRALIDRLHKRRGLLVGLAAFGLLASAAGGVLLWTLIQAGGDSDSWAGVIAPSLTPTISAPSLAPPQSLKEVADQYPQLTELLTDSALSSVYKEFIVAYESGGPGAAEALADKRGLLNERDEIRITLVLDSVENVPMAADELRDAGVTVEGSYQERINVGVPMTLIQQLAQSQGIEALFERITQMEHIVRLELAPRNRPDSVSGVEGEGASVIGAGAWHAAGFTGRDIRVGVLDMGFDGFRSLLGGELPDSVTAKSFVYGMEPDQSGEVHGTACAEIVHEVAPEADLFLAYYDGTIVSEGRAVDWLLEQGVHIISHSAGSVLGPMDGTGDGAELVDEAAAEGVLWVNSSGNEAQAHYRGRFTDADGDGLHEFDDGSEEIALWPHGSRVTVVLNWDDWDNLTEDYDIHVYDASGDPVASSEDTQDGSPGQMSAEGIDLHEVAGTVYYVSIEAYRVTRSATLDLYTPGAKIEFPVVERSLNTPADARGALTVGATDFRDDSLASYSSQGPTTDGRLKPDVCAPTGVSGATYGEEGFDGTSASAPHVAGAAALVWSAFGDHSRDDILTYLTAHSLDLGPPGPDNVYGHGRAQLSAAPALGTETAPPAPAELPIPSQQVETIVPTLAVLLTATPVPVSTVTGTPHPEKPIGQSPTDPSPSAAPFRLSTGALAAVGATAFCGGAAVLGGAGMLLIARERPRQHASGVAVGSPDARSSTVQIGCGILKGRGIDPIPLRRGAVGLGRAGGNDVVLSSPQVSRFHARIVCGGDGCIVEDLGSVNGTFVDGERVTHAVLKAGSRLRLGDVELIYDLTVEHRTDAWLEVGGRRHWVPATGISIGTTSDNDLRVSDELASRRHARVDREGDEFTITDLGSTNGTFVNRRRVRHEFLHDGDEIRIGLSQVRFRRPRRL